MNPPNLRWAAFYLVLAIANAAPGAAPVKHDWTAERNRLVDRDVIGAGVKNRRVIEAMRETPRHEFVPRDQRSLSYADMALPIGHSQTISSPFIVAYMTEQIDPQPEDRVLEIGTGSGYQAAVLSPLVKEVYTIEIVEPLGHRAARDLKRLKYTNVFTKVGDGFKGWQEHAPFDKIIVTCSPEKVPAPLVEQLKEGGRMIIPVGERYRQVFHLLKKENGGLKTEALRPTLFVPMTGEAEVRRKVQPDPLHPALLNGDFEEAAGDPPEPVDWYYQRQLEWISEKTAPSGTHFARFTSIEPGRQAQAIQGFPVDGRKVKAIRVSLQVRGKDLRTGEHSGQFPGVRVNFYDENRGLAAEGIIGPWKGSFGWQRQSVRIAVPAKAREAILVVGLLGGVGELDVDDVRLAPADDRTK